MPGSFLRGTSNSFVCSMDVLTDAHALTHYASRYGWCPPRPAYWKLLKGFTPKYYTISGKKRYQIEGAFQESSVFAADGEGYGRKDDIPAVHDYMDQFGGVTGDVLYLPALTIPQNTYLHNLPVTTPSICSRTHTCAALWSRQTIVCSEMCYEGVPFREIELDIRRN